MSIEKGDKVKLIAEGEKRYGVVMKWSARTADVLIDDLLIDGPLRVKIEELEKVEPVRVTADDLGRLARYEMTYDELCGGEDGADLICEEKYRMKLSDVAAALEKKKKDKIKGERFADEWFWPVFRCIESEEVIEDPYFIWQAQAPQWDGLPNEISVLWNVWNMFEMKYGDMEDIRIKDIMREISVFEKNRDKPVSSRTLTYEQKWDLIDHWDAASLRAADADYAKLYKKTVDGLCRKGDIMALDLKAYACYGAGEFPYEQDWKASESCLLKLMELAPNADYANTLGYIYYYGRTNGGTPEYEKAFRYFSIGSAGGNIEARYKLADMFRNGYGVQKDMDIAYDIVYDLYNITIEQIRNGIFDSKFADVAFRMGNMFAGQTDGYDPYMDEKDVAYRYYLQAAFAIKKRMEYDEYYGDESVAAGIEKAMSDILGETSFAELKKTVRNIDLPELLKNAAGGNRHIELRAKELSGGRYSLTFRAMPRSFSEDGSEMLITVPEAGYCDMRDRLTIRLEKATEVDLPEDGSPVIFDDILDGYLFLYGRCVGAIRGEYSFRVPKTAKKKETVTGGTI